MKYVLVTGAFGGMGTATVRALTEKGYTVLALDKRVGEASEGVIPVECDLSTEEGARTALERVQEVTNELYAIVHFAGVYMLDSLVEIDAQEFERIFKVNVFSVYYVNKAFAPLLKKDSRVLITTSELAPLDPLPFTGIYAVTKGALDKYAYSLRMELQLKDVYVSVLRAGAVDTGMLGASTTALDRFCDKTELYAVNSKRFKNIVNRVEARHVSTGKLAKKAVSVLHKKRPKFAYSLNRNPLLLLLNALPKRLQLFVIRKILK